jgi:hypothetical protein
MSPPYEDDASEQGKTTDEVFSYFEFTRVSNFLVHRVRLSGTLPVGFHDVLQKSWYILVHRVLYRTHHSIKTGTHYVYEAHIHHIFRKRMCTRLITPLTHYDVYEAHHSIESGTHIENLTRCTRKFETRVPVCEVVVTDVCKRLVPLTINSIPHSVRDLGFLKFLQDSMYQKIMYQLF